MNQQDNTPIDVDASKPISRADKARGFVRNRRGLTCASRALVLMAWGLGAWCISRYWPADSSWSTEMLGLGSLLVGMTHSQHPAQRRVADPSQQRGATFANSVPEFAQ